jgi:hypothetical protein
MLNVSKFEYLGITKTNISKLDDEIRRRMHLKFLVLLKNNHAIYFL